MWLYIVGGVAILLAVAAVWGVLHLRQSQKTAYAAIAKVALSDIERLRNECEQVFKEKFAELLDLNDLEHSATLLSARLDNSESLKSAFAKEDFYWYFVLPVGAFIGELLRIHAGAEWKQSEEGGLEMSLPLTDGSAATFPFDKVMKQVTMGDKGDMYAYLNSAVQLEAVLAKSSPLET